MRKVLIPVLLGGALLPATAIADSNPFDLPELSSYQLAREDSDKKKARKAKKERTKNNRQTKYYNPEGVQVEDLQDMGEFGEIIQAEAPGRKRPGFKRTRILSGIEYTETVYDDGPQTTNMLKIYADGNTLITDNFRLSYVVSERDKHTGQNDEQQPGRLNLNLTPRFEQWVSPAFNYYVAAGYKRAVEGVDDKEETTYRINPGLNFNFGKNFVGVSGEIDYKEHTDNYGFSLNANLVHRWRDNINLGIKGSYTGNNNEADSDNWNFRGLMSYRFTNGVRTEWNIVHGRDGGDGNMIDENNNIIGTERRGYKYTYYNMNTNIPLTDTFSMVANVSYRTGDIYNPGKYSNGDKEQFMGKLAIISSF
ncbi:hypothetical protein [Endozoicomonas elysicola]|uniref:Porin domain-containing protein n=1 Tax=Endozoicomonas elysicola TaxID=305900 RepID=A0A081KBI3_9GAMM|nr:hypothetical protein [Endozoicomonas elysicola]KEI71509.1 hypothetical protein GV64_12845 [Endozoicomonas elysicola]